MCGTAAHTADTGKAGCGVTDLGNEVLHDVGRVVTSSVLAVDHDCVSKCLRVVL